MNNYYPPGERYRDAPISDQQMAWQAYLLEAKAKQHDKWLLGVCICAVVVIAYLYRPIIGHALQPHSGQYLSPENGQQEGLIDPAKKYQAGW